MLYQLTAEPIYHHFVNQHVLFRLCILCVVVTDVQCPLQDMITESQYYQQFNMIAAMGLTTVHIQPISDHKQLSCFQHPNYVFL